MSSHATRFAASLIEANIPEILGQSPTCHGHGRENFKELIYPPSYSPVESRFTWRAAEATLADNNIEMIGFIMLKYDTSRRSRYDYGIV
jgi:hypothetical protein